METFTIDQIILQWKLEKITAEQAISYSANMAEMQKEQHTSSAFLHSLTKQVDRTPKKGKTTIKISSN